MEVQEKIKQILFRQESQIHKSSYKKNYDNSNVQYSQISNIIEELFQKLQINLNQFNQSQSPQVHQILQNYQEVIQQKNQTIEYLEVELKKTKDSFRDQKEQVNEKIKILQNLLKKKSVGKNLSENEYDNIQEQIQSFQVQLEQTQLEKDQQEIENQKIVSFVESINSKLQLLQDIKINLEYELRDANKKVLVIQKGN